MEEIIQKRQLAAIMFTDIVGYTALMGEDSSKALELVRISKEIQKPLVEKHNGQWLKEMGDGAMAKFSSALDAVNCAIEIQQQARAKFDGKLRIGIHLGDITIKENDVYGDGVNIASRLESIADPGGIYISDAIFKAIQGQTDVKTQYLGEVRLKNVRYEVRTYALQGEGLPIPSVQLDIKRSKTSWLYLIIALLVISIAAYFIYQNNLPKPEDDSIKTVAVLPFKNISNDSETNYFVDGIMRVILDNLARIGDLEVTSGKAVEPYAEGYESAKEVGEALDVDYLIETKVEKVGNKVKIMVQLIDTRNDHQIWDETYDEEWKDVLKLQSDLSLSIAQNLNTTLTDPEMKMIRTANETDPQAQDYLFKAWDYYTRIGFGTKEDIEGAKRLVDRAIAIDSTYAMAWLYLGALESELYFFGDDTSEKQKQRVKQVYEKAYNLEPSLMEVQWSLADYSYKIEHDYPKALELYEQLLSQYPRKTGLMYNVAFTYRRLGKFTEAAEIIKQILDLKPTAEFGWLAYGQLMTRLRKYPEAERAFNEVITLNPAFKGAYYGLIEVQIDIDGNYIRARETLNQPMLQDNMVNLADIELRNGNFQKAIDLLKSDPEDIFISQGLYIPKSLMLALFYNLVQDDSAKIYFQKSINPLLAKLEELPDDHRIKVSLGLAYAGLGNEQKASQYVKRLEKYIKEWPDALVEANIEQNIILMYIMLKEFDLALSLIRKHLDNPTSSYWLGSCSIVDLKLHPMFDPLRELPEFQALLKNPKYQINLDGN